MGNCCCAFCCCCVRTTVPKVTGAFPNVGSFPLRIPEGVFCRVFYPGASEQETSALHSVHDFGYSTASSGRYIYTRAEVIRGISLWTGTKECTLEGSIGRNKVEHFTWGLKPSPGQRYPVIIFSHGLGGNADIYSKICAEMASLGYIVFALEHEDGSGSFARDKETGEEIFYEEPPSGKPETKENVTEFRSVFLEKRREEVAQVLGFLRKRDFSSISKLMAEVLEAADLEHFLFAGHSFGGATVAKVIHDFEEMSEYTEYKGIFRAAILLDVWSFPLAEEVLSAGIPIPTVSFLSDAFHENKEYPYTQQLLKNSDAKLAVYVRNTTHAQYSDAPWFSGIGIVNRISYFEGSQDSVQLYAGLAQAIGLFLSSPNDFSIDKVVGGLFIEHELA